MERVVTATEARVRFGEIMRRVADGSGAVVVEKDGKPKVVILSLEEYSRLKKRRQKRPEWQRRLDHAHRLLKAELGDRRLPPADELVRDGREERDAQLAEFVR
ncbi:MAG TPA: type II toxin-antitoxin system Phd/YefM family antitoxin [Thermoanaerobaculia bacterium]|nr:type II toxin-antitoxin system Phd/YefM family antitoxin [Thermoanaerobaculia bacterium]